MTERDGQLGILDGEADDVHSHGYASFGQGRDGRRGIAASGFLAVGQQHDQAFAFDCSQVR